MTEHIVPVFAKDTPPHAGHVCWHLEEESGSLVSRDHVQSHENDIPKGRLQWLVIVDIDESVVEGWIEPSGKAYYAIYTINRPPPALSL